MPWWGERRKAGGGKKVGEGKERRKTAEGEEGGREREEEEGGRN